MLKTEKSNPNKPYRIMVYGKGGVGKSTLGATAERPIIISLEEGSDHLKNSEGGSVDLIRNIKNWDQLKSALNSILKEEHNFKTLVLDSADWIETFCQSAIIGTSNKSIATIDGGYGAGFKKSKAMHRELLEIIIAIREQRNMNVIITAHAHTKAAKDPSAPSDYETFEIKCHEDVSSMWSEWVDALFFVRFKTYIKESDDTKKNRAVGTGERILFTEHRPSFNAKNRYGLPPEMNFTMDIWNELKKYIGKGVSVEALKAEINEVLSYTKDETLREKVIETTQKAGENITQLEAILLRLKQVTTQKEKMI